METNTHPRAVSSEIKEQNCYTLSMLEAGTGCMIGLADTIRNLEGLGYVENLVPCYDHFSCQSGLIKMPADTLVVEKMVRFENASDPDDQAILYAISSPTMNIKGLYVDSYGAYHVDLCPEIMLCLKNCPA